MRPCFAGALAGFALFVASSCAAWELPERSVFLDPVDGRLDASRWLLERKGFLPVPILITEPAVGYGGGVALLFFHRNVEAPGRDATAAARFTPPDITGLAGFGTENGSRGGGALHLGYAGERRWRYFGAVGSASMNLAWYGAAGLPGAPGEGLDFNLDGRFAVGDVRRRIGESEWWLGLRYLGGTVESRFERQAPDAIPARQYDTTLSGLGLVAEYDGRDSIFTPGTGTRLYFESIRNDEALGSDQEYTRTRFALNTFHPLGERLVIGLRAEALAADGDVPFYARPFIELRGIPALRYQGDRVAVVEAEARWDLDGRWSLVGFAGAGSAASRNGDLGSASTRTTLGVGVRYLLARALGLHGGLDVARGPEETAIYIIVGSAWR